MENLKKVLYNLYIVGEYPQEIKTTALNRAIAKATGSIHPQVIDAFIKGMEEIGVLAHSKETSILLRGADDL